MEMPPESEPSEGVGVGMLLVIGALGIAAAVLAVLLVTRQHGTHTSTVFVTRAAATIPAQTQASPTTARATTAQATTAQATTAQQTTTQARATVPRVSGDLQAALQAVRNAGFSAT